MQECHPERREGSQAQQLDPAEHSPPGRMGRGRGGKVAIQLDRASRGTGLANLPQGAELLLPCRPA